MAIRTRLWHVEKKFNKRRSTQKYSDEAHESVQGIGTNSSNNTSNGKVDNVSPPTSDQNLQDPRAKISFADGSRDKSKSH